MMSKKQIRKHFRDVVFERDEHKCVMCKSTTELDAHHITDRNEIPNGGYVIENGITLCSECHVLAEEYHRCNESVEGYSPTDLYNAINSSFGDAVEATFFSEIINA